MIRPLGLLLSLIYPERCPFCGRVLNPGEEGLCFPCQKSLPWTDGAAVRHIGGCDAALAPLWYRDGVRQGVHRYKFQFGRSHSRLFGHLMAQCLQDHLHHPVDLITWVPLSKKRLRERGYDQAELLARQVAAETGLPAVSTLVKTRNTKTQSRLSQPQSRQDNVAGAYLCRPEAELAGKRVVLVDDVATSGATLSACAHCLRQAGAAWVAALTLARAQ